jgi:hypothetical protein
MLSKCGNVSYFPCRIRRYHTLAKDVWLNQMKSVLSYILYSAPYSILVLKIFSSQSLSDKDSKTRETMAKPAVAHLFPRGNAAHSGITACTFGDHDLMSLLAKSQTLCIETHNPVRYVKHCL